QLELRRLLDGEVGGLRALQDLVHERGSTSEEGDKARAVGNQTPVVRELTEPVHHRQAVAGGESRNPASAGSDRDVSEGGESLSVASFGLRDRRFEVLGPAQF